MQRLPRGRATTGAKLLSVVDARPGPWPAGAIPCVHRRKVQLSLRVDHDVLEWFRAQGPGYQTRMDAVLRAYMDHARG